MELILAGSSEHVAHAWTELGNFSTAFVYMDGSVKYDFFFRKAAFILKGATCSEAPSNIGTMEPTNLLNSSTMEKERKKRRTKEG